MRTTRSLISSLRLFRQCLLLGFLLTPVLAVGQCISGNCVNGEGLFGLGIIAAGIVFYFISLIRSRSYQGT
jgi:hypothetical protein